MDSDLIVLPRAAVEGLLRGISRYQSPALRQRADDLLAAAKPAIDAGVTQSEDEDVREDQPSCEIVMPPSEIVTVPRRGRYRWLVIAADAAEEG